MVNKQELEHAVILLKKHVEKAKARTIVKIHRKVKVFTKTLEKNPANEKIKMKMAKFLEEKDALKNISKGPDNIKKVIKISTQNFLKLMADPQSTVEERSIAKLLYMNDFLQTSIKQFKEKFNLKDDDTDWMEILMRPGRKKMEMLKKKKKIGDDSMEAESASEEAKESPKKKKKAKKVKTPSADDEAKEQQSPKKNKKKKLPADEKEGEEETQATPKKQKKEKPDKSDKVLKMNDKSKKIHQKAKGFVANKQGKNFQKKMNGNTKPGFDGKPQKKTFQKPSGKNFASGGGKPRQQDKGGKKGQDHPSWEAKKKQKPAIANFQGKKTTFTD